MEIAAKGNENTNQPEKSKRKWVYAKKPAGKLYNYRQVVGYSLLLFLFAAPFIKINGNPFLMFNIVVAFGVAGPVRKQSLWNSYSVGSNTLSKAIGISRRKETKDQIPMQKHGGRY